MKYNIDVYKLYSYAQYLEMCSRLLRNSLKDEFRAAAIKRGEVGLKKARWVNGKQEEFRTASTF